MKNNIVLIGFMGCGKSSVGTRLAQNLQYTFLDTDQYIEKNVGCKISELFAKEGEAYFRSLETATIEDLKETLEHTIVSTGGGLPIQAGNGEILKEMGLVVYLKVTKKTILSRLKGDTTRPLLQGDNVDEKVEQLLSYRSPIYEKCAHVTVSVDDKSFDQIIAEIKEKQNDFM